MILGRGRRRRSAGGAVALTLLACLLPATASALPDGRAWEMVSPVDKNGGEIAAPGELNGGGALQASADGESVTYGSAAAFAAAVLSAPPASQYLARRGTGGWASENVSRPLDSGAFPIGEGSPYRLFSLDLARALHLDAFRCAAAPCPRAYALRENGTGALITSASEPDLVLAGASPDLRHAVLSTCAALTPGATEVPLGDGCDPGQPNLYRWSGGSLTVINPSPGARLAGGGAASGDGSRIYWTDLDTGNLFLRDGAATKQVDVAAGGGGFFETAAADGSVAYFTKGGHLWRYQASTGAATDLTPAGGVEGVLGASADTAAVYYLTAAGLFLRKGASTIEVAATADVSNYPPAHGTARVSVDGGRLAFLSTTALTAYDNTDPKTGLPHTQVYLYDAAAAQLRCLSCRPSGARPAAPSSIPGSVANGIGPAATDAYKPRALALEGRRVFFETRDAILSADTNGDEDVYQWEAQGTGSCTKAAGCVELISSGRSEDGATFVDASVDGEDVFFLTDRSLVPADPGSVDIYDARVGGGFPQAPVPIPCVADACQPLPPEPVDPALATLFSGPGNPPVKYRRYKRCRREGKARATCQKGKTRGKRSGKGARR